MPSTRAKNLERLKVAFPSEEIPSEGAFTQWGATYLDRKPYMDRLHGKSWDQLDSEYMVRRSDALGFLNTSHLAAVLPLYLRALVEVGPSSPAAGVLTLVLTKPSADSEGLGLKRFSALVQALTSEQRTAVAYVLRGFSDEHSASSPGRAARAALEAHWWTYLPAGA
jgi:hypothetical protein